MPDASGMSAADRADPNHLSYKFKRQFKLFLSYPIQQPTIQTTSGQTKTINPGRSPVEKE